MLVFGNATDIRLNGNSATKVFLNNNQIWPTTPTIITSNLQLELLPSSYIGSGNVWDTTVGTTDATLFGNPVYNNLEGFTFNGTSTYGTIPSVDGVTNFTNTQQYTIEVWFNPSSGQENPNESEIVEKWNSNFSPARYPYTIRFSENGGTAQVRVFDGSNNPGVGISGFSVNTWVQLVAVFNFGVEKTLTVYRNGVSAGSTSLSGVNQVSNTSFVSIAGRVAIGEGSAMNKLKGTIGIIRMYDTSLNESQVLQNFNADKSKFGL